MRARLRASESGWVSKWERACARVCVFSSANIWTSISNFHRSETSMKIRTGDWENNVAITVYILDLTIYNTSDQSYIWKNHVLCVWNERMRKKRVLKETSPFVCGVCVSSRTRACVRACFCLFVNNDNGQRVPDNYSSYIMVTSLKFHIKVTKHRWWTGYGQRLIWTPG